MPCRKMGVSEPTFYSWKKQSAAIAASEKVRRPVGARHPAITSGEAQTVMSPRRTSARSYAAQSRTQYRARSPRY